MQFEKFMNNGFLYNVYQNFIVYKNRENASGFFDLPKIAKRKTRVLDIGCGPATRTSYFTDAEYYGFDYNKQNIEIATRKYKNRPDLHFVCADINEYFCSPGVTESVCFDLVIMHGVLHHLDDNEITNCVSSVKKLLRSDNKEYDGEVRFFDPIILHGNSALTNFILKHDRGKFIRTQQNYVSLLKPHFSNIETKIFTNIYRLPIPVIFIRAKL